MNPERKGPQRKNDELLKRIVDVVNLSQDIETGLFNTFNLKGESSDEDVSYGGFACISYVTPNRKSLREVKIITKEDGSRHVRKYSTIEIQDKILNLKLPEEVETFYSPTYGQPRDTSAELTTFKLKMPYGIIAFGRDIRTEEEVITMFAVSGQLPKEVIRQMQKVIRSNKFRTN